MKIANGVLIETTQQNWLGKAPPTNITIGLYDEISDDERFLYVRNGSLYSLKPSEGKLQVDPVKRLMAIRRRVAEEEKIESGEDEKELRRKEFERTEEYHLSLDPVARLSHIRNLENQDREAFREAEIQRCRAKGLPHPNPRNLSDKALRREKLNKRLRGEKV